MSRPVLLATAGIIAANQAVAYAPQAAITNGTGVLKQTSGNMFAADGKTITIACNFILDGTTSPANTIVFCGTGTSVRGVQIYISSAGSFQILLRNSSATNLYYFYTASSYLSSNTIYGLFFSADLASGLVKHKLNGSDITGTVGTSPVDDNMAHGTYPLYFGGLGTYAQPLKGKLGPLWAANYYIDPDSGSEPNLSTFFDGSHKLKYLEDDGRGVGDVIGAAPGFYLPMRTTDITDNSGTQDVIANLGARGTMTEQPAADTFTYGAFAP